MNAREAKRLAYHHALNLLETARGGGWPIDSIGALGGIAAADADRIDRALDEITSALARRGGQEHAR